MSLLRSVSASGGASTLRAIFELLLSQHARLLTLETSFGADALLVERVAGREAVSELFEFQIDCLSSSAHWELKTLIGEEVTLRILQADGSTRPLYGVVAAVSQRGADGGLARYRLTLKPWIWFAALRRNSLMFQDKTVLEIGEALFERYPLAHVRTDVQRELRRYSIATQYRESDFDFLARRLSIEGLSFYFEHLDQATSSGQARHRLVICDERATWPACPQPVIRFHRIAATEASDAIHALSTQHRAHTNALSLASWDYKKLRATSAVTTGSSDSESPTLEIFDSRSAYRFEHDAEATRVAAFSLQALETTRISYSGSSAVRALGSAQHFTLTQHPDFDENDSDNRFLVLSVEHEAANNIEPGMHELGAPTGIEYGSYRNRFTAISADTPLVPAALPTPAMGLQTALVVGLENEAITTERDHRVKIQFPWARGFNPNPGGLYSDQGHAPGNDTSGTWVRVAETLSGPNYGSNFIPRIGHEVLVDFIDGDIDRPVIVGQLYNGQDIPPYAAGTNSDINHAGTISGIHTEGLDKGHSNQWLLDDTQEELRLSLKTSYAASEYNHGYLIHQNAHTAARGSYRGSGFELRTDAWGVLRAPEGLLVSTHARPKATSTQLDISDSVERLNQALESATALSTASTTHHALPLAANDALKAFIDHANQRYSEPQNGQEAAKPQAGSRQLQDPVERFEIPLTIIESTADTAFASPASSAFYAGANTHISSLADTHLSAQQTLSAVSGKGTSLFTHATGIKAIAANGPVSFQAHTDRLNITADRSVTIQSVNDEITINANDKITLYAGNASITLDGPNITFTCPGKFSVKGVNHDFAGAASGPAILPMLPQGTVDEATKWLELDYRYGDLNPVANAPYKVVFDNGMVKQGQLDSNGRARLEAIPGTQAKVYFGEDPQAFTPAAMATAGTLDTDAIGVELKQRGLANEDADMESLIVAWSAR